MLADLLPLLNGYVCVEDVALEIASLRKGIVWCDMYDIVEDVCSGPKTRVI